MNMGFCEGVLAYLLASQQWCCFKMRVDYSEFINLNFVVCHFQENLQYKVCFVNNHQTLMTNKKIYSCFKAFYDLLKLKAKYHGIKNVSYYIIITCYVFSNSDRFKKRPQY